MRVWMCGKQKYSKCLTDPQTEVYEGITLSNSRENFVWICVLIVAIWIWCVVKLKTAGFVAKMDSEYLLKTDGYQ